MEGDLKIRLKNNENRIKIIYEKAKKWQNNELRRFRVPKKN